MTPVLLLCGRGDSLQMRWAGCTCLHDIALLDGRVLQPAGLLLQLHSRLAEWQAGDHVLRDPERALAHLHRMDLRLE